MKRLLPISVCMLAVAACQDAAPTAPGAAPAAPSASLLSPVTGAGGAIEPALRSLLATASPAEPLAVIVNFDDALVSRTGIAGAVRSLGVGVIEFKHLSMLVALATPAQVTAIAALPGVQGVYDNGSDHLLLRESVQTIGADRVFAGGTTGAGVGIAIMDSGINGLNPDVGYPAKTVANVKFTSRFEDLAELAGLDPSLPTAGGGLYVENLPNTDNSSGHGSHVAGIAAGSGGSSYGAYRGVAPGAHLVGLSVGEGAAVVNISVLQAVDWLLEHGDEHNVQVLNCSWGTTGEFDPAEPINEAMKAVHDAGITVLFAAGNDGPDENTLNPRSAAPWVISVAAGCKVGVLDPTNSASQCADGRRGIVADFSSRGIAGHALYHPDITAPGVRIVSTRSLTGQLMNSTDAPSDLQSCNIGAQNLQNYTCASGTSMASPHVAGVVALMEEASGGRLTPAQALEILTRTARPLLGYGQWEVGAGYMDAYAAVAAARKLRR